MRPEELRQRRLASGLTIADLAKESGISRATISKIENGYSQSTPLTLTKLEAALVHPCQELLEAAKEARDELEQYLAPWAERLAERLDAAIESYEHD